MLLPNDLRKKNLNSTTFASYLAQRVWTCFVVSNTKFFIMHARSSVSRRHLAWRLARRLNLATALYSSSRGWRLCTSWIRSSRKLHPASWTAACSTASSIVGAGIFLSQAVFGAASKLSFFPRTHKGRCFFLPLFVLLLASCVGVITIVCAVIYCES